jgi:hypothetical protein
LPDEPVRADWIETLVVSLVGESARAEIEPLVGERDAPDFSFAGEAVCVESDALDFCFAGESL